VTTATDTSTLVGFLLRHADDNTVLGQRLGEYISNAPELEEDLAVANVALDHIGVAMHLYEYAAELEGGDASADSYAMLRTEREYRNALLVEQPNTDFAFIVARGFFCSLYQTMMWEQLASSTDERLRGIAARALKEATYHQTHDRRWLVTLGDGTDESHERIQRAIDGLWRFTGELFEPVAGDEALTGEGVIGDIPSLKGRFDAAVDSALEEATLVRPEDPYQASGGRTGMHSEHLGHLLAEMQWMQRTYPGATW
jgi:ring-1,2-phenylacetyl-CoA epoxidase subunit PaaC